MVAAGLGVSPGVLALPVHVETLVGLMLHGADQKIPSFQFGDQLFEKGCLP